jgi:heptosyltransferase-2
MTPRRILVLQTAFLGDVVLTLPLVQVLHRHYPHADIDFLATPRGSEVLRNHPSIHSIIEYDKRGRQRGLGPIVTLSRTLKANQYDVALVPHRSLRSAVIVALSRIPIRIGFDISAGSILFSELIPYNRHFHEIERNLSFLNPLRIEQHGKEFPSLYPSQTDEATVEEFLSENGMKPTGKLIAIAPGSMWNTKRWLSDRFAQLAAKLSSTGMKVVLVGGKEDEKLCVEIAANSRMEGIGITAGRLSILQSAELIRRSAALVTNDSAPMHLAVAMHTPVVAIFGATVPSLGFAPYGDRDAVVQIEGLPCKPCSIHGGDKCPIGTFECMERISVEMVYEKVMQLRDIVLPRI